MRLTTVVHNKWENLNRKPEVFKGLRDARFTASEMTVPSIRLSPPTVPSINAPELMPTPTRIVPHLGTIIIVFP